MIKHKWTFRGHLSHRNLISARMKTTNGDNLRQRVSELEARLEGAQSVIKRLTENEVRQNELFELMTDAVFVQRQGRIVFANPAAAGLHGFETPDQLIGVDASELIHPDDLELILSRRRELSDGATLLPAERRGMRRDGTLFQCETRGSQITWEGEPAILVVLRDITGRKQAEREAAEKSALLGTTLEIMDHGYCVFDAESRLLSFNQKYIDMYRFPPGFVRQGMHHGEILRALAGRGHFGDGDIEELVGTRLASADAGEARNNENTISDGTTYLYQRRPMPNGGFVATFTDITDRKRAEQAVHDSEARYRGLIEESILPIQISTVDRSFLYVNRAYLDLLGYGSTEEFFERRAKVIAPRDRDRIIAMAEARKRGEDVPDIYEYDAVKKDGTIVPLQSFSRRIVWEGKEAYQRTLIDLTERREAERSLLNSEARFRDLIEGSLLGIQIATKEKGRVFANQACVKLFGYDSLEDLFAIPRWNLIAEHDRKQVRASGEALFAGEAFPAVYEFDGMRKDGSVVPIQSIMRRIVWQGEDAIQRTFLDLTERKRAEDQLRQAQKMEAVGQLTGGIAHDFNNLLTVVQGNLQMMTARLRQPDMVRLAETALKAAKRGSQLTQRLLAFSRKQTLAPEVIRLDRLVADMSDMMRRTLGETIEIEVATESGLWNCEIDPGQLENAILNLALNARDAMARGGRLTIKTENVVLNQPETVLQNVVPAGDYVVVSVADTGTGMSADELEHAFEPFFTTKDVGQGSGLGLSMVHGFISQSDGFVTIDSAKGAGTTVKMYLPKSTGMGLAAPHSADTEEPLSRGELVLVVEDDPDLRAFTVTLLDSLGYDTVEAGNGKAAVEILRNIPGIHLLFTDVVLPGGMSGVDIAKQAASLVPGIKILFTSGYADDVLARHGQTYEKVQLITKPFQIGELARHLRSVLDGIVPGRITG